MHLIKSILSGLAGAAVMICLAVSITVWFRPLYYFDIDYLKIPQHAGVTAEVCRMNYDTLIDYNVIGGSRELHFPTMQMSQNGRVHFEEVKEIFLVMQAIAITGIAAFAACEILGFVRSLRRQTSGACGRRSCNWMLYTVRTTELITLTVLLAVLIDWDGAFVLMHKIFFDNDYWLFNPKTDPIITILPDTFFLHCGILIICLTAVFCGVLKWIYNGRMKKNYGKTHI